MPERLYMGWSHPSTVGALVREHTIKKSYVSEAAYQQDSEKYNPPPVDTSELEDAFMCLALVGPYGPHILASWISEPVWAPVRSGVTMFPLSEGFGRGSEISADECSQARDLFAAFCMRNKQLQARLRLAGQRLLRAMRRVTPVDASIELGIALEVLYLKDSNGELSFRLKTRAARFLGTTEAERKDISTLVGDIYNLRSKAVHTGSVEQKPVHGRTVQQVLQEGFRLTAKTIRLFITSGEPDWGQVMFG